MLKRELKFRTFLLPLMMVSFVSLTGHAEDQTLELQPVEQYTTPGKTFNTPAPASVTPPASQPAAQITSDTLAVSPGQSISFGGKTYKFTEVPAATNSSSAQQQQVAPAQETEGMLDANDLASVGVNMSIKVSATSATHGTATLEGWIAPSCVKDIEVATTGPDYPLLYSDSGDVKSVGFAIRNNGHFLSCMRNPQNNCVVMKGCKSLSEISSPYLIDGSEHIRLAYINAKSGNPQAGGIKVVGKSDWESDEATRIADAKIKAQRQADLINRRNAIEKANANILINCVKRAKSEEDLSAINNLVTIDNVDTPDHTKIIDLMIKKGADLKTAAEKAEITKVKSDISSLLKASRSPTAFAKDKKRKKDDDDDISTDDVADRINNLEEKVYADSATLQELNDAGQLEDGEYQQQENILATVVQNLIKLTVTNDPSPDSFDHARDMLARALGDSDDEDSDQLHPSDKVRKILRATDPTLAVAKIASEAKTCMSEEAGLAAYDNSDCDDGDYKKLYNKLVKKETHCVEMRKMDKDEKAECKANSNELKLLNDELTADASQVNTDRNTAIANYQRSRGVAGIGQQNPMAAQLGLQNGQFPGSPQTPNFGNAGVPVFGAANGLGVNPLAMPYQSAAVNYPAIGMNPYQPQVPFNGYNYLMH